MLKKIYRLVFLTILLSAPLLQADDVDVFSGSVINVPPNVLIVFDTSGSMSEQVPTDIYDPNYDYGADITGGWDDPYDKDTVYRKAGGGWGSETWESFSNDVNNIGCTDAKQALGITGHWVGYIEDATPFNCHDTNDESLAMGNFLNFLDSPNTAFDSKINVAKQAVNNLLDSYGDNTVRFGLMRFNNHLGGEVIAPIGSTDAQIKTQINTLTADGWTPLAETLAEAGLYFAGQPSWANPGTTYVTPIQWRCQKNFIILMTDGNSTQDLGDGNGDNIFTRSSYMHNKPIGDYDNDGADPGIDGNNGTHWLDDVAKFLYEEDLLVSPATDDASKTFDDPIFERQHIITYGIGFATGTNDILLQRMADNQHSRGAYYSAENSKELEAAFSGILGTILSQNSNFVAPVVPVSKMNKVYSGSGLYLGLFQSAGDGLWLGNLKKYGLSRDGIVLQKDATSATDPTTGNILTSSTSIWTSGNADGLEVTEGGAGADMLGSSRNFYTYQTGNTNKALSYGTLPNSNLFNKANTGITAATLGVTTDTERDDLIDYIRAEGVYAVGGSSERKWIMGDIIHSLPVVMQENTSNKTIIFVGSNDGFLHCFVDNDQGDNDNAIPPSLPNFANDTIDEAWTFAPWDLLGRFNTLHSTYKADNTHEYFVDGSPLIYQYDLNQQLTFGLRRGGNKYYTLKVGSFNAISKDYTDGSYANPEFLWEMGPTVPHLSETMGQSWFKPHVVQFKTGSGDNNYTTALLFTGGYDADQDDDTPNDKTTPTNTPASNDEVGRAIFAVDPKWDAANRIIGGSSPKLRFSFSDGHTAMTHSIISMTSFDSSGNGYTDSIYAPDLAGNLFAFTDRGVNGGTAADGTWEMRQIFKARQGANGNTRWLKCFYAPDITMDNFTYEDDLGVTHQTVGEFVFMGTGDRANPGDCYTVNRFYGIKNKWQSTWSRPLYESDLGNVRDYNYPYTTGYLDNGWFFNLDAGEKVISTPITFEGVVYFTTFLADCGTLSSSDMCATSGTGVGRLYAVKYQTGEAAFNYTGNDVDTDASGTIEEDEHVYEHRDRYLTLVGLPTVPVLIVTAQGPQLLTGTTQGIFQFDIGSGAPVNRYFWKQQ